MLATNRQIMDMIDALGPMHIVNQQAGIGEIEMPIPDGNHESDPRRISGRIMLPAVPEFSVTYYGCCERARLSCR
jgi:hypothetical protein